LTASDLYRSGKEATALVIGIDDEAHALSFGSGVFISQDGLLLTNAHVIHESTRILVYGATDDQTPTPEIVAVDPDLDLAALRLTYTHPVPYLSLAKEPPEEGMTAVTIGYPRLPDVLQMGLTIHPTVFPVTVSGEAMGQSRIAHKPLPFLHITGLMNAGSSGGPLVAAASGDILGLVVHTVPYLEAAKNSQGEAIGRVMLRAGLSYCIPSARIREWLDANHLWKSESVEPPSQRQQAIPKPTASAGFVTTAHLLQLMADVIRRDPDFLDMAIRHYESALTLESNRPDILHDLGRALASRGNVDDAWTRYELALALTPDDLELLTDAGDLRRQQRQFDKAVSFYRKALRQDPCYSRALLGLGSSMSEQGDSGEAGRVFQVAAHCPSSSSLAAYQLGIELERHGESIGALAVWEQALGQLSNQIPAEQGLITRIRHRASQLRNRLQKPSAQTADDFHLSMAGVGASRTSHPISTDQSDHTK
jgi:Tfp pilus assembly protein PilF